MMSIRGSVGAGAMAFILALGSLADPVALDAGTVTGGAEETVDARPSAKMVAEEEANAESAGRGGWGIGAFPVVFSTPETGFGGGAGLVFTYRAARKRTDGDTHAVPAIFFYTEKGQSNVAIAPDLYFHQGDWHVKVSVSHQKLPSHFYQVGRYVARDHLADDAREDYTLEAASFQPWVLRRLYARLRAGLAYDLRKGSVLEKEGGGILEQGLVHAHDGGVLSGLGPALEWDSRDHIFYPSRGGWYQLYALFYSSTFGSDLDFEAYWLDLRRYVSVRPSHILAFQVWWSKRAGDIPFTDYAAIGGQMRGIYAERLQDRYAVATRAEYRYPIWGRFSGVSFASLGDVAHTWDGFGLGGTKYAVGAGLRFALNADEKLNIRFDVGLSEWGAETYFQYQEAF